MSEPTEPEHSWRDEFHFWATKGHRAPLRHEDALKRGDKRAADLALKQIRLYNRRLQAAVPDDVRARWERQKQEELRAALDEI